jgi:hypothetical protein
MAMVALKRIGVTATTITCLPFWYLTLSNMLGLYKVYTKNNLKKWKICTKRERAMGPTRKTSTSHNVHMLMLTYHYATAAAIITAHCSVLYVKIVLYAHSHDYSDFLIESHIFPLAAAAAAVYLVSNPRTS